MQEIFGDGDQEAVIAVHMEMKRCKREGARSQEGKGKYTAAVCGGGGEYTLGIVSLAVKQ